MESQNRITFTKIAVGALPKPEKGRVYTYDTKVEGLAVCVTSSGNRTFYVVRWHRGRCVRARLGKFPTMSVEQAQKAARATVAGIAEGRDPAAERRQQRQEPTLAELWDSYLDLHAKPRKKSWRDDQRQYAKYMPGLRSRRLSSITQAAVAKWHGQLAKDHGPIQANRCKALLATMYSKASAAVGYSGPNPCIGVANFAERSRERFLLPAEMAAFFTAVASEGEVWRDFYMVALFTGARRGVVASMRWAEVDLVSATWHIPATKTKNKRPNVVAMAPPVLAILEKRWGSANGCEWVFPSDRIDGHIIDCRKSWARVLSAAGIADLHVHDLRRSLGSWQAALGASLAVIGKSLGHADLKSTQVYARLQLDPVRESVSKATSAMIEAAQPKTEAIDVEVKHDD